MAEKCARTVCTNPEEGWFNHSTRKRYCADCAKRINKANRGEARRLYGHDLCTKDVQVSDDL